MNVGFVLKEGIGFSREFKFDEPEVVIADDLNVAGLRGLVTLTRTPQGIYTQGRLQAHTTGQCVRCLTDIQLPVSCRIGELFHYPPESAPEGELAIGDDIHIDLNPLVREDMLLSIPIQTLCRPDCKGLCPQCGQNWNEGPCNCDQEPGDPRLAVLKTLLDPEDNQSA